MTTVKLVQIPDEWFLPDEDGERLSDSFETGMILEVSVKGDQCRIYQPEDVLIDPCFLEYLSGDRFNQSSSETPRH